MGVLRRPILLVVLFSFNSQRSLQRFTGFSFEWYQRFLENESLTSSLRASLEIATVTMVVGTLLGTLLAFGLVRARTRWAGSANVLMLIPLVTPEIVAGVSALLLFTQVGLRLSLLTIMLAHITFSISYVTVVVRARLASLHPEVSGPARGSWRSSRTPTRRTPPTAGRSGTPSRSHGGPSTRSCCARCVPRWPERTSKPAG